MSKKKYGYGTRKGRTLYLIDGCNLVGNRCPNPEQVVKMWGDLERNLPISAEDQIFVFVDGANASFLFAAQLVGVRHSLIIGHGADGADKKMLDFAQDLEHYFRQGFTKIVVGSADHCFEELVINAKAIGFETTSIVSIEGAKAMWVRESDNAYCLDGRRLSRRNNVRTGCTRDDRSSFATRRVLCRVW